MSIQNILLFLVEFFSAVMLVAKLLKECLYIFFPYKLSILKKKKKNYLTTAEVGGKAKLPTFVKRLIILSGTLIPFQLVIRKESIITNCCI